MKLEADVVIVGSGVAGATIAKELSKGYKKVLVVEKGANILPGEYGTEMNAYKFYDKHGLWSRTKDGVFYYRSYMVGGTGVVSCANGVRSLEKELEDLGIDLEEEFQEVYKELNISPVPDRFIGRGTRRIIEAADKLGYGMEPMPKFIDFERCISCGNCFLGCQKDAKWNPTHYLQEAKENGVTLLTDVEVIKVLTFDGEAVGVEGISGAKERVEIVVQTVILSAGGLATPVILQNSGLKAGEKLFLDLFNVTFGLTREKGLTNEIPMAAVNHQDGFMLSPFLDSPLVLASVIPASLRRHINITTHRDYMLGIMVKIKDDCVGGVDKNGVVSKAVTKEDAAKLHKGVDICQEILIEAGADPESMVTTKVRGAHPGGTAAIGEVVDEHLSTRINRLYVCDASVLPVAPGRPPIVTIAALSKWFSKYIRKVY
jgi:choline dehydrogenase-like flavoprotein